VDDEIGEITQKLFAQNFEFVTDILKSGTANDQQKVLRLLNERSLTDTSEIPAGVSVEEFVSVARERLITRSREGARVLKP
jgi:hypothetical protein